MVACSSVDLVLLFIVVSVKGTRMLFFYFGPEECRKIEKNVSSVKNDGSVSRGFCHSLFPSLLFQNMKIKTMLM